jgi:hypothetical protein
MRNALKGFVMTGLFTVAAPALHAAAAETPSRVERGAYLVSIMSCNDCHTPLVMGPKGPEPDKARLLSGHPQTLIMPNPPRLGEGPWGWAGAATNTAFAGPWGVSYTANLTPDKETGLGLWTDKMFIDTMRTGRHQGRGRMILPPMPVPSLNAASDEDLRAIFAYLQSLPPVKNQVPQPMDPPEVAQK